MTIDTITSIAQIRPAGLAGRVVLKLHREGYTADEVWAQGTIIYGRHIIGREISRVLRDIKEEDKAAREAAEEAAERRAAEREEARKGHVMGTWRW